MKSPIIPQVLPIDWPSVKMIETALHNSPSKTICLEINDCLYQLSIEGKWFKFSRLTKKRTIKRATIFETIGEIYNKAMHGQNWRIAEAPI